jgi:phosphoglycerate dehydrogenase-like enzyme
LRRPNSNGSIGGGVRCLWLFALDNVILTPHSAGLSKEAAIRVAISIARSVLVGIDGKLDPR